MSKRKNRNSHKNKITKHHLTPKCRGGHADAWNILNIYRDKHDVWHTLFKERTLEEAIILLKRVQRMKDRQRREAKCTRADYADENSTAEGLDSNSRAINSTRARNASS